MGEFASSIDPVVKLIPFLEEKVAEGVTPSLVLMSDQFGVLHAPFACARAFLAEHGYEDLKLIVHNRQGCLQKTTIAHLSPQLKRIKEFRMGVAVVEEQRTKPLRKKKSDKKRTKPPTESHRVFLHLPQQVPENVAVVQNTVKTKRKQRKKQWAHLRLRTNILLVTKFAVANPSWCLRMHQLI